MKLIPRSGVVLTKICGINFFVSTREASEHCPLIGRPGIFEILCWEGLKKGKTEEDFYAITEKVFKMSPERARQIIQKAITGLVEKGYLIEAEEPSPLKQYQNLT